MATTRGDVQDALTRIQAALDDLARALDRERIPAQVTLDRTPAGWPVSPRGLTGPRRLAPVSFPPART